MEDHDRFAFTGLLLSNNEILEMYKKYINESEVR